MTNMKKQFQHPDYDGSKLQTSIVEIINSVPLWSMSTVNGDQTAHINTAYFCFDDDFKFYCLTSPSTRHSENVHRNDSAAVSIFDTDQPWGENPLRGLQIFGTCKLASGLNEEAALREYGHRFPTYLTWVNSLTKGEKDDLESKFYCFTPTSLKLLDEKRFGEENFISVKL
jgi:uncharacterized protein YhbP (UPF0306 family)